MGLNIGGMAVILAMRSMISTSVLMDSSSQTVLSTHQCMNIKKLIQPIDVNAVDLYKGTVEIVNGQYFSDMAGYNGRFELMVNGEVVQSGAIKLPALNAGESGQVTLPIEKPDLPAGGECHLMLRFFIERRNPLGGSGA